MPGRDPQHPYVSRSLLRAVRNTGEPAMASSLSQQGISGVAIEMSLAPSGLAVAAVACPLQEDARHLDVLYAILPPQYGTGEWLALASLAAKQYQQAEQVWRARRRPSSTPPSSTSWARPARSNCGSCPAAPSVAGLDLAVGFAPCRWVGGDYVDVVPMADGRTLLTVADVCGKGMAAALVSASLHTMVHGSLAAGVGLQGLMRNLNHYLCDALPDDSFVTMVAVAIDPATGRLECANAGHPPPLLLEAGREPRELHCGANYPLGCEPGDEPEVRPYDLPAGGLLALYTDGLTEQFDEGGEQLGPAGLAGWLRDACVAPHTPAAAVADSLNRRLSDRKGQRFSDDDRTFLLARRP